MCPYIAETGYEDSGSQHEQLLAPGADHHQGPAFYFDYSNSRQQQQQTTESRSADTQARVSVMGDGSTVKAAQGLTAQEYHPPYKQLPACLEGHLPLNKRQHEVSSCSGSLLGTMDCGIQAADGFCK